MKHRILVLIEEWKKTGFCSILAAGISLTSCGGGAPSTGSPPSCNSSLSGSPASTRDVLATWSPNHEKLVNQPGGGYRVYYSPCPGFSIEGAPYVDAPYASGASAPTSATLPALASGITYYLKIVAYSALSTSSASGEQFIKIP
jgi:hypothetical protein